MAILTDAELKALFENGDTPDEDAFASLIDSLVSVVSARVITVLLTLQNGLIIEGGNLQVDNNAAINGSLQVGQITFDNGGISSYSNNVDRAAQRTELGLGTIAVEDVGWSGSFTAQGGETVTVVNGIITAVA